MGNLQGRVAVIAGGSGGFGEGIAERFLSDGATVWIAARDPARGKKSAEKLGARFHRCDITRSADVKALADLPSREVLFAEFAGAMEYMLGDFAGLLENKLREFVYAMQELVDKGGPFGTGSGGDAAPAEESADEAPAEPAEASADAGEEE